MRWIFNRHFECFGNWIFLPLCVCVLLKQREMWENWLNKLWIGFSDLSLNLLMLGKLGLISCCLLACVCCTKKKFSSTIELLQICSGLNYTSNVGEWRVCFVTFAWRRNVGKLLNTLYRCVDWFCIFSWTASFECLGNWVCFLLACLRVEVRRNFGSVWNWGVCFLPFCVKKKMWVHRWLICADLCRLAFGCLQLNHTLNIWEIGFGFFSLVYVVEKQGKLQVNH